jgi:hypothetical protein
MHARFLDSEGTRTRDIYAVAAQGSDLSIMADLCLRLEHGKNSKAWRDSTGSETLSKIGDA